MSNKRAKIIGKVESILIKNGMMSKSRMILACYLIHYLKHDTDIQTIDDIRECDSVSENIRYALSDAFDGNVFYDLMEAADELSDAEEKDLIDYIIYNDEQYNDMGSGEFCTPKSIIQLAKKILDIHEEEFVGDFCSGYGDFLISAALDHKENHFFGVDINTTAEAISEIRTELLGIQCELLLADAFSVVDYFNNPFCFNKIFSNYPFVLPLKMIDKSGYIWKEFEKAIGTTNHSRTSDWLFNYLISSLIVPDGKAIGIMTNGSTWNSMDLAARRYFVENGLIEAVINLPEKMFNYTAMATSMIVLSHNNSSVRLIDATDICIRGRRVNEFSEDNINEIVQLLNEDGKHARTLSKDELRENEYVLNTSRYYSKNTDIKDGSTFETVINTITRGAHLTAVELDKIASIKPTKYQYLMLGNIKDGIIESDLPFITDIDRRNYKYCLHDHSLVISKNGYPYKIAVAEISDDKMIMANGNLYIINLDENKADPYYIKAYFESEQGIEALNSISVGATIPNIGVDKLKKLIIPLPSLEEQRRIAANYQACLDEVRILKKKLAIAIDRMHHVVDEENR